MTILRSMKRERAPTIIRAES
ncbi:hypothetical protein [Trinickia sp.]